MKSRNKRAALLCAALTIGAGVVASGAAPAQAAIGDNLIVNGDFEAETLDGSLLPPATTDFNLAQLNVQGTEYAGPGDLLTSWDEGTAVVGTNPYAQHILWYDDPSDQEFIVNGFTDDLDQVVWAQEAEGIVCEVGEQVQYDFSAVVANILPQTAFSNGGAAITVVINGEVIADIDLTSNDGTEVPLTGNTVPALETVTVQILNGSTVKIGNDFSLDDISLVQTSGCLAPVTPAFLASTPATCDAPGGFEGLANPLFPLDRGDYTLSISPDFTGAGTYTLTATADEGFAFPEGTVTTAQITIDPLGFGLDCTPAVGGRTIGFWGANNQNGTAAGPAIWNAAKLPYANAIPASTTFTQAQALLKVSGTTNLGKDMLRAQFIATALNVKYIDGYGAQQFVVPATSAIDGGQTVTVVQYLSDINAGWAGLDTKAEISSVQNVLNLINQDIASILFL